MDALWRRVASSYVGDAIIHWPTTYSTAEEFEKQTKDAIILSMRRLRQERAEAAPTDATVSTDEALAMVSAAAEEPMAMAVVETAKDDYWDQVFRILDHNLDRDMLEQGAAQCLSLTTFTAVLGLANGLQFESKTIWWIFGIGVIACLIFSSLLGMTFRSEGLRSEEEKQAAKLVALIRGTPASDSGRERK